MKRVPKLSKKRIRRRVGMRTVTYAGRVVYTRKHKRIFILPRIAKIFTGLMKKYNEKDPIEKTNASLYERRAAPTSTIFYFFQQSLVWLQNRNEFENIFVRGGIGEQLESLRKQQQTTEPDVFVKILEGFYRWFDDVLGAVYQGLGTLKNIAPELGILLLIDQGLITLYYKVREEFPI